MRNLSDRGGPGKRQAYWEEQIHVMVERGEPVYEVYPAGNDREKRVLHKNLLLPYAFLPITQTAEQSGGLQNLEHCQDFSESAQSITDQQWQQKRLF